MTSRKKRNQIETLIRRFFQTLIVLILLALVGRGYVLWLSSGDTFAVAHIQVKGADYFDETEVLKQCGLADKANLRSVSLDVVQARLEANPFIESVAVHKAYPRQLRLSIREKQPVALLNVQGSLLCIDKEGLVLPARPGRLYELPVISGRFEGQIEAGTKAGGARIKEGLNFIRTLLADQPDLYDKISEVVVGHDKGTLVYTTEGSVPVWFGKNASSEKMRYFDAIYEELESKRQFAKVKYIDLRYKQQVILGMRS